MLSSHTIKSDSWHIIIRLSDLQQVWSITKNPHTYKYHNESRTYIHHTIITYLEQALTPKNLDPSLSGFVLFVLGLHSTNDHNNTEIKKTIANFPKLNNFMNPRSYMIPIIQFRVVSTIESISKPSPININPFYYILRIEKRIRRVENLPLASIMVEMSRSYLGFISKIKRSKNA